MSLKPLVLTTEQEEDVARIVSEPTRAALVAHGVGVGKTLIATEACLRLGASTVLIIGPKNVLSNWKRHFNLQAPGVSFKPINSTAAGKANFEVLSKREPGVYYVGREFMVTSGTSVEPKRKEDGTWTRGRTALWSWLTIKPDVIVLDESHAIQNRYSLLYDAVLKKMDKSPFRIALSATPAGNRFDGIWATCRWLWPDVPGDSPSGLLVDRAKTRWLVDWCLTEKSPFSMTPKVLGEKKPGAWVAQLPCYLRREADLGTLQHETVYVELTPKQRKMWDAMANDALVWLDENPLVAEIPIVQRARLRQMALGDVYFNEDGEVDFPLDAKSAKLDALEEYLDDEPTLIVTDSQRFIKVILARLGARAAEWSGKIPQIRREEIKATFGKPNGPKYIVATIASIGEGTDGLQRVSHKMFWLSESLNGILNQQCEGRLHRTGQTKAVQSIKILAVNTDDDRYFENLVEQRRNLKESFG